MKTDKQPNLFLDTVINKDIRKFSWLIFGVTTTPTFFKKRNIDYDTFVENFRKEYPKLELHIETLGPTPKDTEENLLKTINKKWFDSERVVIKIPATFDNLSIISKYTKKDIKFNAHLIFNTCQAYLASISGADYVCPLIGRYADKMARKNGKNLRGGENDVGRTLLKNVINAVNNQANSSTKVMASSIRTVKDFKNAILSKPDTITVSREILEKSIKHNFTDKGIKTFLSDMGY